MLKKRDKRELAIDIMASWALEGMEPTAENIQNINDYLDGKATADEIRQRIFEKYYVPEAE